MSEYLTCKEISKRLEGAIAPRLKEMGFKKLGRNWFLAGKITHQLNLQKSAWDADQYDCSYYLNVRFWVGERGNRHCDLTGRLGQIAKTPIDRYLKFNRAGADEVAASCRAVEVLIADHYAPWVNRTLELEELKRMYAGGEFKHFGLSGKLTRLLHVNYKSPK